MLKWADFCAARYHQPGMGGGGHGVGLPRRLQRCHDARAVHSDIKVDGLGRLEQPVEMLVQKGPFSVIKPQTLPHAVA